MQSSTPPLASILGVLLNAGMQSSTPPLGVNTWGAFKWKRDSRNWRAKILAATRNLNTGMLLNTGSRLKLNTGML